MSGKEFIRLRLEHMTARIEALFEAREVSLVGKGKKASVKTDLGFLLSVHM